MHHVLFYYNQRKEGGKKEDIMVYDDKKNRVIKPCCSVKAWLTGGRLFPEMADWRERTDVIEIDNVLAGIKCTTRTNRKRDLQGISSCRAEKKGNKKEDMKMT